MTHHATRAAVAAAAHLAAVEAIAATEAADIEWGRAYREATGARSSTAAWRAAYIAALEQDARYELAYNEAVAAAHVIEGSRK